MHKSFCWFCHEVAHFVVSVSCSSSRCKGKVAIIARVFSLACYILKPLCVHMKPHHTTTIVFVYVSLKACFPGTMKCYEAVEEKIGSCFEKAGQVIASHPWKIIIVVILVNGLLGIGMMELKTDIDVSRVYTPMNSQATKDESAVIKLFPDKSGSDFYNHQAIKEAKSAVVIVKPNSGNILDIDFLEECKRIDSVIRNVTGIKEGEQVKFVDICAIRGNSCVISGDLFLMEEFKLAAIHNNVTYPDFRHPTGEVTTLSSIISGGVRENDTLISATHLIIQYFLRSDSTDFLQSTEVWAEEFIEAMKKFSSDKFEFAFSHTDSLSEELNANIGGDITLFSVTFTLMIVYACLATYTAKHDCIGKSLSSLDYFVMRFGNESWLV